MSKLKRPQFFAMYKDFNDGKMKPTDVLHVVLDPILNQRVGLRTRSSISMIRTGTEFPSGQRNNSRSLSQISSDIVSGPSVSGSSLPLTGHTGTPLTHPDQ